MQIMKLPKLTLDNDSSQTGERIHVHDSPPKGGKFRALPEKGDDGNQKRRPSSCHYDQNACFNTGIVIITVKLL